MDCALTSVELGERPEDVHKKQVRRSSIGYHKDGIAGTAAINACRHMSLWISDPSSLAVVAPRLPHAW